MKRLKNSFSTSCRVCEKAALAICLFVVLSQHKYLALSSFRGVKHEVSLCLPAIKRDLLVDDGVPFRSTLQSIRQQTVPPLEVIIGLSECSVEEAESFQDHYRHALGNIHLTIVSTVRKGSVGANRNRAARRARGGIISFFDIDGDIMHPQRVEAIKHTFTKFPKTRVLVHSYSAQSVRNSVFPLRMLSSRQLCFLNAERVVHNLAALSPREWVHEDIHHGHLSISKDQFRLRQFDEDFNGEEDSIYVNSAIESQDCDHAVSGIFLNASLSLNYLPRSVKLAQP